MKQITLSPSKLSLFLDCKRCFWFDVNRKVRRPSGIFPSLPSGMDGILKKYFDTFREKGELPPELKGVLHGKLFDDMDRLSVWRNNFKGLQYLDEDSGILLRGAQDEVFVTAEGEYMPVDFKTRGYPLKEDTAKHYQHQMDIYCFLLHKNGLKTAKHACLIFYHPTKVQGDGLVKFKYDVVKMKTSVKNGEKLFMDAVKLLQGPEPKNDGECPWCNWSGDE